VVDVAVNQLGRELILAVLPNPSDAKHRFAAIGSGDGDPSYPHGPR
jgi:hypothetical protein